MHHESRRKKKESKKYKRPSPPEQNTYICVKGEQRERVVSQITFFLENNM
jgi:hypothetical protein